MSKAEDNAADATVNVGRGLLLRVFGHKDPQLLPPAVAKVIANPADSDYLAALRVAIRDVLENNAQVLAEVREILAEAKPAVTSGKQEARVDGGGVAEDITAGGDVSSTHTVSKVTGPRITAGRDAYYSEHDMTITRNAD